MSNAAKLRSLLAARMIVAPGAIDASSAAPSSRPASPPST